MQDICIEILDLYVYLKNKFFKNNNEKNKNKNSNN